MSIESVPANDTLPASDAAKILKGTDFEVLARARAGVDIAEQEAEEIVAQAHADAQKIREEAAEQGRRDASRYLSELAARVSNDLVNSEQRLVGIVMDALKKILDPIPPEKLIVAAVRRAVADVDLSRGATLVMAPEVLPRVRAHLEKFPVGATVLDLNGDPTCPPDSTILRTPYGDVELDVDAQLEAIAGGLEAALGASSR